MPNQIMQPNECNLATQLRTLTCMRSQTWICNLQRPGATSQSYFATLRWQSS